MQGDVRSLTVLSCDDDGLYSATCSDVLLLVQVSVASLTRSLLFSHRCLEGRLPSELDPKRADLPDEVEQAWRLLLQCGCWEDHGRGWPCRDAGRGSDLATNGAATQGGRCTEAIGLRSGTSAMLDGRRQPRQQAGPSPVRSVCGPLGVPILPVRPREEMDSVVSPLLAEPTLSDFGDVPTSSGPSSISGSGGAAAAAAKPGPMGDECAPILALRLCV